MVATDTGELAVLGGSGLRLHQITAEPLGLPFSKPRVRSPVATAPQGRSIQNVASSGRTPLNTVRRTTSLA